MKLRIKQAAKEKGVTIVALSEMVGLTQPGLSNIANGKSSPSLETLERIAKALGVPVASLFEDTSKYIECPVCHTRFTIANKEEDKELSGMLSSDQIDTVIESVSRSLNIPAKGFEEKVRQELNRL